MEDIKKHANGLQKRTRRHIRGCYCISIPFTVAYGGQLVTTYGVPSFNEYVLTSLQLPLQPPQPPQTPQLPTCLECQKKKKTLLDIDAAIKSKICAYVLVPLTGANTVRY